MAIFSGASARKTSPRGTVLRGKVTRESTRTSPPLRVTGVVRLYAEGKKNKG